MQRRRWTFLIPIGLVLAAAMFDSRIRHPNDEVVHQCVGVYADGLPTDVLVRRAQQDGPSLTVYVSHLDWTAEIRCALYRDGSLDEVGTLNRKDRVFWAEPPMPSNP